MVQPQTSKSSHEIAKLHLPQPWLDPMEGANFIQQIEVRKAPNSPDGEFLFGALPNGDNFYTHEVEKKIPAPQYGTNVFAVSFSNGPRARTATQKEWESGSRIATKPRRIFPKGNDDTTGEIEYKQKRYAKAGKYWGDGLLSPTGKWLAVFSWTGKKPPPDIFFGGAPRDGDIFWQIYDTVTGKKVFEWEAKNVKSPTSLDSPVVWLEDHYFLFPDDQEARNFNVVTLPPVTPEINPVTLQLPSRKDPTGQPLPAGARDEVWIPLVPLTKEQAEKLTAGRETEITAVRLPADPLSKELLLAINEETENRRVNRQQRDGAGDYHFKVISTYYYAVTLDNPTQTRIAGKEEWDRGRSVRSDEPTPRDPVDDTVTGTIPPYRQFAKTGASWGSPQLLGAGEWIAVFSYSDREMFVDLYDQRLGGKLLTTELPLTVPPNELFKRALWIEGGYVLLPLNASFDSFAFWQLPGGM